MNFIPRPLRSPARLLLAGVLLIPLSGMAAPLRPMTIPSGYHPRCDAGEPVPAPADSLRCSQTVLFAADHAYVSVHKALFRKDLLVALEGVSFTDRFVQAGWWQAIGSAGPPGTLWWGRSADGGLWAMGWESADFPMRHAMLQVRPGNAQSMQTMLDVGARKLVPFPAARVGYAQVASPQGAVSGGLGGDGAPFMPAPLTNARLVLETIPTLQGELEFDVAIEGRVRAIRIPLKRNMDETRDMPSSRDQMFRLRAGAPRSAGGKIDDCPKITHGARSCLLEGQAHEYYDATGVFYGPNSEYLAVRFTLTVDIPERHKTGSKVDGLLIMRGKP